MLNQNVTIREVNTSDNFEEIYKLINETGNSFLDPTINANTVLGESPKYLKQQYCNSDSQCKGFVATDVNGNITAFMGIIPSNITKNGHIQYGILEENDELTKELLNRCSVVIQKQGGTKIFKFAFTKFGQVRNKEVSFYEKYGFESDDYSFVTIKLSLQDWMEPAHFDSSLIESSENLDRKVIQEILKEDGEDAMAELFRNQFSISNRLDEVILVLRDRQSQEIAGVAYYRVGLSNKDTKYESFEASAFGVHFRPKFNINLDEKRRFIQGYLKSMLELNIKQVITRLTLKNFDTFVILVKEGFNNEGLEQLNTFRLYKTL